MDAGALWLDVGSLKERRFGLVARASRRLQCSQAGVRAGRPWIDSHGFLELCHRGVQVTEASECIAQNDPSGDIGWIDRQSAPDSCFRVFESTRPLVPIICETTSVVRLV